MKRIVDSEAMLRAKLSTPWCCGCGCGPERRGLNAHHVLPKDKGGDDLRENLICLCGSGTMGCHGAHHGNPYVVKNFRAGEIVEERRDAAWVNSRIGEHLVANRPDVIAYVLEKLGEPAGPAFLADTYSVPLDV